MILETRLADVNMGVGKSYGGAWGVLVQFGQQWDFTVIAFKREFFVQVFWRWPPK